jgi:lipoprotein-anchoring transpeptidase ErfK/SrfK
LSGERQLGDGGDGDAQVRRQAGSAGARRAWRRRRACLRDAPTAARHRAGGGDPRARTLSVYRRGIEIGRSSIVYGYDEKPTPLGAFAILQKKARHVSNIYNAPMPWMLRLTWDGVAIHGSEMADDKATHGCIGVPNEFGERLFALAAMGGRVLVNNGPPGGADYSAYAALPYSAAL